MPSRSFATSTKPQRNARYRFFLAGGDFRFLRGRDSLLRLRPESREPADPEHLRGLQRDRYVRHIGGRESFHRPRRDRIRRARESVGNDDRRWIVMRHLARRNPTRWQVVALRTLRPKYRSNEGHDSLGFSGEAPQRPQSGTKAFSILTHPIRCPDCKTCSPCSLTL